MALPVVLADVQKRFIPLQIPNLDVWLKADALALSDGNPIATWADLSGNGKDFTQSTEAKKPLYKTGIQNGRPGVLFDGVDDTLTHTVINYAGNFSMFVVAQFIKDDFILGNTDINYMCVFNGVAQFGMRSTSTTMAFSPYTFIQGDNALVSAIKTSGNISVYDRGVIVDTIADAGSLGLKWLGSRQGTAALLTGYMFEIIIYAAAVTVNQQRLVRSYLTNRWGV